MQDSSDSGSTPVGNAVRRQSAARVVRIEVEATQEVSTEGDACSQSTERNWPAVLEQAKAEGYNTVSIVARAFRERELGDLLRAAANCKLAISLNVAPECLTQLPEADTALVQHWVLRLNSPGERAANSGRMTQLLQALRVLGTRRVKTCFAFHLDPSNLDDLPWAAWLAAEQGVASLTVETAQVHGTTAPRSIKSQLDVSQRVWSMLVLARARQRYPAVRYEIDLSDVNLVRREPQRLLAVTAALAPNTPLAEWVSPLVIDPHGNVTPLLGTLSPKLALGNLRNAPLHALSETWKANTAPAFQRFCRQVHADVCENTALPFFNWAEHLHLQSRRMDAIVPRLPSHAPERAATVGPPEPGTRAPAPRAPTLLAPSPSAVSRAPASTPPSWSPLRPDTTRLPKLPWAGLHDDRVVQTPLAQRAPSASRA
jgi:hypothetical protein